VDWAVGIFKEKLVEGDKRFFDVAVQAVKYHGESGMLL